MQPEGEHARWRGARGRRGDVDSSFLRDVEARAGTRRRRDGSLERIAIRAFPPDDVDPPLAADRVYAPARGIDE